MESTSKQTPTSTPSTDYRLDFPKSSISLRRPLIDPPSVVEAIEAGTRQSHVTSNSLSETENLHEDSSVNAVDADDAIAENIDVDNVVEDSSTMIEETSDQNQSNLEQGIQLEVVPAQRIHKAHPQENIIGQVHQGVLTRSKSHEANICLFSWFLSQVEPKKIDEALKHSSWIEAMQEELLQFKRQVVWKLVDIPPDTDSDYGGYNLDKKSTSGGCQFLGGRLISWQCKKQTCVSTSTAEAEYIAASSCCAQIIWIQNQMLDYGMNFMATPIHIDNMSAISITNNSVQHSKTKHIDIRYHFIRDQAEKKRIILTKVHTNEQYADLFTKPFDEAKFKYLVESIVSSIFVLQLLTDLIFSSKRFAADCFKLSAGTGFLRISLRLSAATSLLRIIKSISSR
ncbi:hypothetical protein L1987_24052 [Smallanthus sonchifolius]|uniref:Uncharacterized protein n=1 Tax=Smallanthus sonchifolius TaxID=185202 RepID=A0ACB9IJB9_9ASTR|nr:hypothetical protein L1987_24052 [Smallanthus sonchifolius]